MIRSVEILVEGLDHPEGVAYDHESGSVYAGGELGQVYEIDVDARAAVEVGRVPGFALGLAVDGVGRVVVCDGDGSSVWAFADRSAVRVLGPEIDGGLAMPNFPAFGPDGTLYVTDSGGWKEDRGKTIALRSDGSTEVIDNSLARFPNGCAVTPDGSELWVIQSEGENLSRIDLRDGGVEEIVSLAGTVPDGIALTENGGAVISCYRPDRIYYLSPDGDLEVLLDDYQGTLLAAPTNVCFAGEDRDRLIVSSLGRWHLTIIDLEITGVRPHTPTHWALDISR